jgi:hypothetical protein
VIGKNVRELKADEEVRTWGGWRWANQKVCYEHKLHKQMSMQMKIVCNLNGKIKVWKGDTVDEGKGRIVELGKLFSKGKNLQSRTTKTFM